MYRCIKIQDREDADSRRRFVWSSFVLVSSRGPSFVFIKSLGPCHPHVKIAAATLAQGHCRSLRYTERGFPRTNGFVRSHHRTYQTSAAVADRSRTRAGPSEKGRVRPTSRSDLGLCGGFECPETSTHNLHLPTALPAIVLFDFVIVGEGEGVICELQPCKSVGVVIVMAHKRWGL